MISKLFLFQGGKCPAYIFNDLKKHKNLLISLIYSILNFVGAQKYFLSYTTG